MRLLVIEDDKGMADTIRQILSKQYIVDMSYSGKSGSYKAHVRDYDLILIDFMLPDLSGIEVCKKIRGEGIMTPIIFLTAHQHIRDRVKALNAGADDYLLKPFSARELLARIRAVLRRSLGHYNEDILTVGDLVINTQHRTVIRGDRHIRLRRKAFDLLEYLVRNKGRVLNRDLIMEHVWEDAGDELSNTVSVHMKHIRDRIDKKNEHKLIKTVYGVGYRIGED